MKSNSSLSLKERMFLVSLLAVGVALGISVDIFVTAVRTPAKKEPVVSAEAHETVLKQQREFYAGIIYAQLEQLRQQQSCQGGNK